MKKTPDLSSFKIVAVLPIKAHSERIRNKKNNVK